MSVLDLEKPTTPQKHRFTLQEYLRMSESGLFDRVKVELIDGEIYEMPAQNHPHMFVISKLARALQRIYPEEQFWVRIQGTVQTADSAPDPDFAVLRGPPQAENGLDDPADVLLVVEVADSTLLFDTTVKASLYASGQVPEYWVVSIPDRQIIVHRQPTEAPTAKFGWKYGQVFTIKPGTPIAPLSASDQSIDPATILP